MSTHWVRESLALSLQVAEQDVELPQPDWGLSSTRFWALAQGCAGAKVCWPPAASELWGER